MHSFTRLTPYSLLLAPLVAVAAPAQSGGHGHSTNIIHRQSDDFKPWKGDSDGNLKIQMSDTQINFGNAGIKKILDSLKDECSEISCGSRGKSATVETGIVDKNWALWESDLKGHVSGSFRDSSPGAIGDLFKAALAAMEAVGETKEWAYHDNAVCNVPSLCEAMAENSGNDPNTEYWYPDEIHLRVQDGDGAELDLTFELDSGEDGFCEVIEDVGGDVSDAVGVGGTGFSLIELGCTLAGE